ncbi:hypothetical protein D3C79_1069310 [compost metagenome]
MLIEPLGKEPPEDTSNGILTLNSANDKGANAVMIAIDNADNTNVFIIIKMLSYLL